MDLAVVGAGAAAVCLLDSLARRATEPGRLLVFEPSPHLWRGGPYRHDLDEVRLNLPPAMMSARHGEATHFADWLRAGPHAAERYTDELLGQSMPPRAVYGAYLEDTAEAALAVLRSAGWLVEIVRAQVTGARNGDRLTLHSAAGRDYTVDRAVLCVGSGAPHDFYGLAGAPGFTLDPYPLEDTLQGLDPAADIAVIGSGLTAMDVAVALAGAATEAGSV
jgi:uncharacterized NAD(P)/FAD-binding protein YdhS